MYCRNCKAEVYEGAPFCRACGVPIGKGKNFCPRCGGPTAPEAIFCVSCGAALQEADQATPSKEGKSAMAAGLLGIFLGVFGVHNFYLKRTGRALTQLGMLIFFIASYVFFVLSLFSMLPGLMIIGLLVFLVGLGCAIAAWIWALVEAILLLCGRVKVDGKNQPLAS